MALAPAGPVVRKCNQHSSCQCVPLIRLAIRSTPSPAWEKAFIVALCQAAKLHCRVNAPNYAPVARRCNRRRAGKARPRGKAGNERRKACFHPGGSGFSLPRGSQGHFQFYQLEFYVTYRFLGTFLTQESTVPLVLPHKAAAACLVAETCGCFPAKNA